MLLTDSPRAGWRDLAVCVDMAHPSRPHPKPSSQYNTRPGLVTPPARVGSQRPLSAQSQLQVFHGYRSSRPGLLGPAQTSSEPWALGQFSVLASAPADPPPPASTPLFLDVCLCSLRLSTLPRKPASIPLNSDPNKPKIQASPPLTQVPSPSS